MVNLPTQHLLMSIKEGRTWCHCSLAGVTQAMSGVTVLSCVLACGSYEAWFKTSWSCRWAEDQCTSVDHILQGLKHASPRCCPLPGPGAINSEGYKGMLKGSFITYFLLTWKSPLCSSALNWMETFLRLHISYDCTLATTVGHYKRMKVKPNVPCEGLTATSRAADLFYKAAPWRF